MCRGNRKRDVDTIVTYSHASSPLGQSERAYYLSYFINISNGNWTEKVRTRVISKSDKRAARGRVKIDEHDFYDWLKDDRKFSKLMITHTMVTKTASRKIIKANFFVYVIDI